MTISVAKAMITKGPSISEAPSPPSFPSANTYVADVNKNNNVNTLIEKNCFIMCQTPNLTNEVLLLL